MDVYTTEVIADQLQMLGGRDDGDSAPAARQQAAQRPAPQQAQQRPAAGNLADMDDDIPFS